MFTKTKATIICVGLLALVGCDAEYSDKTRSYQLPEELSHCKIYKLEADVASTAQTLTVLHCPGDTTHIRHMAGKTSRYITVEG